MRPGVFDEVWPLATGHDPAGIGPATIAASKAPVGVFKSYLPGAILGTVAILAQGTPRGDAPRAALFT
jgi:hypothetical protein